MSTLYFAAKTALTSPDPEHVEENGWMFPHANWEFEDISNTFADAVKKQADKIDVCVYEFKYKDD